MAKWLEDGFGSSLLGAGLQMWGAERQNQRSRAAADASMDFTDWQNEKQMEFQERMSNTAHQRQVKDLEAAGLNPILAATGGASAPQGASGAGDVAQIDNIGEGMASTAQEAYRMKLATKRLGQEIENMKAVEKKNKAEAKRADMSTKVMSKDLPKAEIRNRLYRNYLEPFMDLIEEKNQSGPKIKQKPKKRKPWKWNDMDRIQPRMLPRR